MDLEEAVTVIKLNILGEKCHLLVEWQTFSFELLIYGKDKIWKGSFSPSRLADFSKNLQMTKEDYFKNLRRCLSEKREDYHYEIQSGFFYWKRKLKGSVMIEGFLPVEVTGSTLRAQEDLIDVLMAINSQITKKANLLHYMFKTMKDKYQKCLKDTEEFIYLKLQMEKALCNRFLGLLSIRHLNIEEPSLNKEETPKNN